MSETAIIDLYTFPTPNGYKPAIALEELAIPYAIHKVDIRNDEQFKSEYVALNPNGKIPTIVDRETEIAVFESGAILLYLAEKAGQLLPTEPEARMGVIQWLFFQVANVGPMFGQLGHFVNSASEPVPYAMQRYEKESQRLLTVLERQLEANEYIAGEYSIADIATFPWVAVADDLELYLDEYPNVQRWRDAVLARPAVTQGMAAIA